MAVEKKKKGRLQTGDENHGAEFDVEREEIRGVEGAGSVERETATEKAVPAFCLSFEEISA